MALDALNLRGIGPSDRGRVIALLARLLIEAAGAMTGEHDDDRV
jgi:hypothetical protein